MERNKFRLIVSVVAVILAVLAVLLSDVIQPGRAEMAVVIAKRIAWGVYLLVGMIITASVIVILDETSLDLGALTKFLIWVCVGIALVFLYPLGGDALDKLLFKQEVSTSLPWTVYALGQYLIISFAKFA